MADRDYFAAAALNGLLAAPTDKDRSSEYWARFSYEIADAMLREREKTNHDAAPAARAETSVKEPTVHATGEPGGEPESKIGTGKQPAPPCVETDGFSPGSRSGQINRSPERQSPDRECGESSLRDVPQQDNCRAAGGPEPKSPIDVEELLGELHYIAGSGDHVEYDIRRTACEAEHAIDRLRAWVNELQLSKAEIDALRRVVENGRFIDMSDYGRLRSLLVRLRPEWEDPSDPVEVPHAPLRNGALSGCETVPDPDSRVWDTPCTPQPHATPTQGSVQGEGSFRVSRNAKDPAAWHIIGAEYDTGCEYEYATIERGIAEAATAEGCVVVPLYRSPTLTGEEREAVQWAIDALVGIEDLSPGAVSKDASAATTLRTLLERLK